MRERERGGGGGGGVTSGSHYALGLPDSGVGDGGGGDLVERDDCVAAPQTSLLEQLLPRLLRVHHHVVQLHPDTKLTSSPPPPPPPSSPFLQR